MDIREQSTQEISQRNNPSTHAWLKAWTEKVLNHTNAPGLWHSMCRDYFDKCCQQVGIDEQNPEVNDREDTILPSGKAISPLSAAQCTWQGNRTAKFIQGIHKAILDLQLRFPNEKLRILYAGCGPLAPLALPLIAHFGSEKISYDCLDIHPSSLERAKTLAKYFQVDSAIEKWICADASTFTPEKKHPGYHLIISEVLQQALQNEPQVAVTINLSRLLIKNGAFIPERIQLSLKHFNSGKHIHHLTNGGSDINHWIKSIAPIFELTTENSKKWTSAIDQIPAACVKLPNPPTENWNPYIFTDIQVYDSIWLETYECSLNLPVEITKMIPKNTTEVEFYYEISKKPGLRIAK